MINYCGRAERLLKKFLMIIGFFTVLYVITYNYHLMTVNIISKDLTYIQGYHIEGKFIGRASQNGDRASISVRQKRGPEIPENVFFMDEGNQTSKEKGESSIKDGEYDHTGKDEVEDEEGNEDEEYEEEGTDAVGAAALAVDDPNHPRAEGPVTDKDQEDDDDDDEGYEGGEEHKNWDNEDGDADADEDEYEDEEKKNKGENPNKIVPPGNNPSQMVPALKVGSQTAPTVKPTSRQPLKKTGKGNGKEDASNFVTPTPSVQNPVTQLPLDRAYCNKKLQIIEQKLRELATEIANVSFKYGKPKNTTKHMCTRYKNEARVRQRYNLTNIWSSVSTVNKEDITFVTQMTTKRMSVLTKVAEHWSGPINVAIYARKEELSLIGQGLREHTLLLNRKNIEFHVVIEDGEYYPVNYLRNVAFNNTATKYVYLSDVDFVPSMGLHENLKARIDEGLLENKTVLVVPGFQFLKGPVKHFPANKKELLQLWKKKTVLPFHWYFRYGHRATNFGKWRKVTHPYYINWEDGFEPYILGKREDMPPYSQRFLARVRNKTSQITEVYYMGFWFKVLPDVFTIHLPHSTSKNRTYYYWCSANAYQSFRKSLKKKYPASKYRARGKPNK